MMRLNKIAGIAMLAAGLALASGAAMAQETAKKPHVPGQKAIGQAGASPVPSLAVLNSHGATLEGNKLTLVGVAPNTIVFSDRPARMAGHVNTAHFISEWDEGRDSFAKDPPNATISVLGADGTTVDDAVVVLKKPKIEGENLTFEVSRARGQPCWGQGICGPLHRLVRRAWRRLAWRLAWRLVSWRRLWLACARRLLCGCSGRCGCGCCGGEPSLLSAALRLLPLSALLLSERHEQSPARMQNRAGFYLWIAALLRSRRSGAQDPTEDGSSSVSSSRLRSGPPIQARRKPKSGSFSVHPKLLSVYEN